jgi:hypothetical protein
VRALAASLLLALLFLGACGSGEPDSVAVSTRADDEPSSTVSPGSEQLYETNAIVIEAGEGPMLCVGAMPLILPPQCGDVPIANWDWDAVPGEESMSGTTYGNYHVVGTYDGEVFSVTETGRPDDSWDDDIYRAENPCPEPEGGWVADPDRHTYDHAKPAHAYARSQPDYVISFVDQLDEELYEFSPVVFVAVFTGERERHEAEISKVWDGPLCVVERDTPTDRELRRIRREAEASLPELGLEMLGSATGGVPPRVEIEVLADPGGAGQAALDARYGQGIVKLFPALRPVE